MTADRWPLRLGGEHLHSQPSCAVVLVRVDPPQFHLGLRRGHAAPEPVVHFGWHRRLRDQGLAELIQSDGRPLPSAVIPLPLDPLVSATLRILGRRVARRYANQRSAPAYGFGEVSATFDQETGEVTDPDSAFTCATFVLAMLRSVGVEILDVARWRAPTDEDVRWQQEISERLLSWIADRFHGDLPRAQERFVNDLGARRYRPTDVAAAALLGAGAWPAGATEVDPQARQLETMLPWSG